jgi:hypothetical protein
MYNPSLVRQLRTDVPNEEDPDKVERTHLPAASHNYASHN